MTPANPFDITIQFKPDIEKHSADELKHIIVYFPDILKEMIHQTEPQTQE